MKICAISSKLLTIIMVSTIFWSCTATYANAYHWQLVTAHDAIQAVHHFENNDKAAVTITSEPPETLVEPLANANIHLSSDKYDYTVGRFTLDVFSRHDKLFEWNKRQFYGANYKFLKKNNISQSQALFIANDFLRKHNPMPHVLNRVRQQVCEATGSSGQNLGYAEAYQFTYYQDCGNSVVGPSTCVIKVEAIRREVVTYIAAYFPVLVSATPKLTGTQAMTGAMQIMISSEGKPGEIRGIGISKPDPKGVEALVYVVTFHGIGPVSDGSRSLLTGISPPLETKPKKYASYSEYYMALVDANTGAVLGWDTLL